MQRTWADGDGGDDEAIVETHCVGRNECGMRHNIGTGIQGTSCFV